MNQRISESPYSQTGDASTKISMTGDSGTKDSGTTGRRITPHEFVPSTNDAKSFQLKPLQIVLLSAALLAAGILWFMFTAKSVTLAFEPAAENVSVQGGISFTLGDVFLLRQGTYTVTAQSPLHEPIETEINVGDARNQTFALNFVPLPGKLDLKLQPVDALVSIDASVPSRWTQPLSLAAGSHTVTVSHPRFRSTTVEIDIEGKQILQEQAVSLRPNWSEVSITTSPAGANIYIDEVLLEQTTPATVQALAGERDIRISLAGHKSHRQKIFAQAEVPQALDPIQLVQADAQLTVTSTPANAGVTLNGQFIGTTPIELDLSSARSHNIALILNGYESESRAIRLQRGDTQSLHLNLTAQMGEVVFITQPADASLTIDNRSFGTANQVVKLPLKEHEIAITLPGYAGFKQKISPRAGITQEIKVKLLTLEEARLKALVPNITAANGQNLLLLNPFPYKAGASRREPGRRANETLREVALERLFYLSTKEVTNAQFRQFASGHDSGKFVEASLNEDDQPAVNLSWHDAASYCNWLSEQDNLEPFYTIEYGKVVGVNPRALGYRLPTESEWGWAARTTGSSAETLLRFPWGPALPPPDRHGNYADRAASTLVGRVIFGYNDNYAVAAPVGTYKSNARGLYDMGGNVAEWTHDFYEIPNADPISDSLGPPNGEYRVIRGSSWMHGTITELRYSFRDYGIDGRQDVGFRIARYAE